MIKKLTTLPTDSSERKNYPMLSGCLKYFPAALAGVSNISKKGNDKHNPGEPLHHARGKSTDHGDCIIRHLTDTEDLLAAFDRGIDVSSDMIITEVNQMAWRVLAYSQEIHEKFGTPLAPAAIESESDIVDKPKELNESIKNNDYKIANYSENEFGGYVEGQCARVEVAPNGKIRWSPGMPSAINVYDCIGKLAKLIDGKWVVQDEED